jgi:hypothetical protein
MYTIIVKTELLLLLVNIDLKKNHDIFKIFAINGIFLRTAKK